MVKDKARIKTGLILGILAIISVFYFPNKLFALLCWLIITVAFWEWLFLIQIKTFFYRALCLILFWVLLAVGDHYFMLTLRVAAYFWLIALVLIFVPKGGLGFLKNKVLALIIGVIVLVPTWVAVVELHDRNHLLLFYLVMTVCFADTAAYFIGSRYGKHKLMPSISPKKSIEGLVGGLVVGVLAGLLEVLFMPDLNAHKILAWTLLSIMLIMISVLGDLFESLMKRLYNTKDSGSFLPGHGGFLDRIDSLTSALPIFFLLCQHLHLFY